MSNQPDLPDGMTWPEITQDWWKALATLPGADDFTDIQWLYLMDTALLHAAVWTGDFSRHGELGKRLEAFGISPKAKGQLAKQAAKPVAAKPVKVQPQETPDNLTPLEAARRRRQQRAM